MAQSKKHHYIPRFYLRGFTNENNDFFIYDKEKDEIRKSNPDNSFFEKYRNSGTVKNEKFDLPEQMLAHFDGRTANVLEIIRNANVNDHVLTPENLYIIRFFIASTFWRIPKNDSLREKIIDEYSFKDFGFGFFNKETGKQMEKEEEIFKGIDLFRKMYTSILAIVSFIDKYKTANYNDWRLIHRTNMNHITGDNPIIFQNGYKNFDSLHYNLIMPLSSGKVLLCTDRNVPKTFPPYFSLLMDMIILYQSERYICSSNEDYLKIIIEKVYKISVGKNWKQNMIDELFKFFI